MNAMLPEGTSVLSISDLTARVKGLLEEEFPSVWVEGEISNLARPNSGHIYLTLKDAGSQLRSVMYRGVAMRVRFEPRDGMEVLVRGRISVYAPRGEYQFIIEELQPKGIGALELALRQLREKLLTKGYFDPRRKKPLPRFPNRVALVTSPTGAAVRDMLEMFDKRWPATEVIVCPVRVQGEGAAQEIAAMLGLLNRLHAEGNLVLDAVIVGRGGGSLEDLWAFNEEVVADAIFASWIPVISAVGHETDVTISDSVADHRALTPTHGVTALTPDRTEWLASLRELRRRLEEAIVRRLQLARQKLDSLSEQRAFRLPLERFRDAERKLDDLFDRLRRSAGLRLERHQAQLASIASRLQSLSPLNILARGYTLTFEENSSTLLRKVSDLRVGDSIVTRLAEGTLLSRVTEIRPLDTEAPPPN
jgi:exodeoxyribonuclease VII large subunit